ncbi:P-loop containing nucleoside triphosphate hydrolase protein [Sparassis latifolia]
MFLHQSKALIHVLLAAVQHPPNIPLQILAGPGSGKTKVLTSRIAHLIAHHNLHPSSICAVTFTNKAANEMRERLKKLLGNDRTADIRMGTFHALCAMFLRRHAGLVGLEGNFTVCDADESKKIVTKLLKPYSEFLAERNITLKEGTVLSHISKAKAKGHTPEALLAQLVDSKHRMHGSKPCEADCVSHTIDGTVIAVYEEYEKTLRKNNSLDFDDLLVFGVKLFGEHASVVRWCRHVLVDEFQDTNIMQYDLMRYIATASRCVTIVGDPDQSIYGWRSAEIANLGKMQRDFPSTQQILLEQNYRSTASILAASIAIMAEDKMRVPKLLHTTHPQGPCPVLREFSSEKVEAAMIAAEVKRLVAYSGGMLGWGDFVVLLRFNALSRGIESALRLEGIPSRVLAGHKFFERLEVKDVLAYLQLIDNPRFVPAFTRVINVPGRSIGEKTVAELLSTAERMNISPLELAERIHDGKTPDIKPSVKRKLGPFIAPIRRLRTLANECMAPSNLIRQLLEQVNYEDHLKKTQPDWESRWDNVQELITFASEVECGSLLPTGGSSSNPEALPDVKSKAKTDETEVVSVEDTPLRLFLQASMLSTDTDTDSDRDAKEKVTISTCHAAKGLEWPVVMIPAVEKGTFPSQRADDIEEERRVSCPRLLYVACTRAQGLLYLSHTASRMVAGMSMKKALSEFIAVVRRNNPVLFTDKIPGMDEDDRALLAAVLRRALPQPAEVACSIAE